MRWWMIFPDNVGFGITYIAQKFKKSEMESRSHFFKQLRRTGYDLSLKSNIRLKKVGYFQQMMKFALLVSLMAVWLVL
jgi:hypothetical protein